MVIEIPVMMSLGLTNSVAWMGLFSIVTELLSIFFIWVLLQEVNWEAFFKYPRRAKVRMFQIVLAVALGHLFAQFILQYWNYSVMLRSFVE